MSLRLVDQSDVDIPGAQISLPGFFDGSTHLLTPTSVTLPITDEGVYGTMTGGFKGGYPVALFPGINGNAGNRLGRTEGNLEVTSTTAEVAFEWIQIACNIGVDRNGALVPGSLIAFPSPFPAVAQGDIIIVPITDDPLNPSITGAFSVGYPVTVTPGDITPTSDTIVFEMAADGSFALGAFTIGGNLYSLTCGLNQPPNADAGLDQIVEWTGGAVSLNGGGSSDDDGDPLTYSWVFTSKPLGSTASLTGANTATPSFTPDLLGDYVVELVVNDGTVDSDPDTVTITVRDTTAPTVSAALVPVAGDDDDHDDGLFRVEFSWSDTCDENVAESLTATLNGLAVTNGQIVKLEVDDEMEWEWNDGILEIKAPFFQLVVTCVDASGNAGTATASPVFFADDDDDDDDHADDDDDDD